MAYPDSFEHDRLRPTPAVQALIVIGVALALVQATVVRAEDLQALLGFSLHGVKDEHRWWTVVTFLFVHGGLWHLLGNLIALWGFGPRLEAAWGTRRFLGLYLASGLGAVALHALFASGGVLFGSSAAVFGVMAAYAGQWPRDEVSLFGVAPIRVRTVVIALAAYNLALGLYGVGGDPAAGANLSYFAHLGGFVVALAYMRTPSAPSIEQLRQRVSAVPDGEDPPRAIPRTLPRSREPVEEVDEIVAKSKAVAAKRQTIVAPAPRPREENDRELVDRLLDKISRSGLASLTAEERLMLEERSRRLRDG